MESTDKEQAKQFAKEKGLNFSDGVYTNRLLPIVIYELMHANVNH